MGTRSKRHRGVGAGAAVVTLDADNDIRKISVLASKVPGRQTVPRAEAWAIRQVLIRWHGKVPLKIITGALYVVKGFLPRNKGAYKKGTNADIWCEVFDSIDAMEVKPTIHKVKSHLTIEELIECHKTNKDIAWWAISNEAADGAASVEADHQGDHAKEL